MAGLPEFYFRLKENGATVFRVETENRMNRLELEPIATVNLRNAQVRPQGTRVLSAEENEAIADWLVARQALQQERDADDVLRAMDQISLLTHWAQSRATDAELEQMTDAILLAMHDLRSVLVRKKAERVMKGPEKG